LISCSRLTLTKILGEPDAEGREYYKNLNSDVFVDHYTQLAKFYLENSQIHSQKVLGKADRYIQNIIQRLLENNELFLSLPEKISFYIVKKREAFYFSIPGYGIFISEGLLKKYIKSEDALIAVLALELVKLSSMVYERKIIYPLGYVSTERLISLMKVSSQVKLELDKWAFYVLKRSDFNPFSLLAWLQTQNKNVAEFSYLNGDARSTSREEYHFKNFIVKEGLNFDYKRYTRNSSSEFYQFMKYINSI